MPEVATLKEGATSRRAFLNPLFVYSVIWTLVLLAYQLGWSRIYAPLNAGLLVFFVATIILSALLGIPFQRWLNSRPSADSRITSPRYAGALTAAVVLGFAADFVYEGHVPFVDALAHTGFAYGDFKGIPVVHVLVVTASLFYAAALAHAWSRSTGRRRYILAAQILLIASLHVLMLSRQAVMLILFMWALMFLSSGRLSARRIAPTGAVALLTLYLFGGIGNMRYGLSFWDNSYITEISKVSDAYPDVVPGQFLWAYIYVVSPLGNLNDLVGSLAPHHDWLGTVINVVPDFISKRLFPEFDPTTPLTVQYFNVSTGFASAWKFNGFVGLWATFGLMVVAVVTIALIVRGPLAQPTWAVLCGLVSFMFFNNAFSYSGLAFAVAYPFLATLVAKARSLRLRGSRALRSREAPEYQ